jgi:hypothetical protein
MPPPSPDAELPLIKQFVSSGVTWPEQYTPPPSPSDMLLTIVHRAKVSKVISESEIPPPDIEAMLQLIMQSEKSAWESLQRTPAPSAAWLHLSKHPVTIGEAPIE